MRFLFAAIVAILAIAGHAISEEEYQYQFAKFQVAYNKSYSRSDFAHRYGVFKTNYDLIVSHNAQGKSWTLAVNEFADLTFDEFRAQKLGYKPVTVQGIPRETVNLAGLVTVPASIDWRTKNAVTPVKNQGQCGSCWAFSTTGSVEGAVAIKTGRLTSLSEQQLVDCSTAQGNEGCNGGLMDDAFQYIISNNGICSESSYPYQGTDGTCKKCSSVSKIAKYVDVSQNNQDALLAAAAQQPVSVAIEADQMGFQFYSGGVFDGSCGTNLDHGVLVAGYGKDSSSGEDYWLVKNSWGASWGENGYIRLVRSSGSGAGQCGIAMEPSYPIAA
jgi:C1A family cysteine protease